MRYGSQQPLIVEEEMQGLEQCNENFKNVNYVLK